MQKPSHRCRRLLLSMLCVLIFAAGSAPIAWAASRGPEQALDAAQRAIETGKLDDATRQLAQSQLELARADLQETIALAQQAEDLRSGAAGQPARMEQLRNGLAQDREQALEEWAKRLPRDADAETLERVLEQERRLIAGLQAQIEAVGGELAQTLSRPAQAASDIGALRLRVDALATPPATPEQEPAALTEVRRLRHEHAQKRAQTELDLRLLEQETATQRQRLHELTIRELRHRVGLHVGRTEHLQERIANLGRQQIESLLERITQRNAELAVENTFISAAAAENLALGVELTEQNERLAADRNALAAIEQAQARTEASLTDSRTRLELGGTSERVGRWWWSERRRLEPPARLQQRLQEMQGTLADLRLRHITLNEQYRELSDIGAAASAMAAAEQRQVDDESPDTPATAALEPLLHERLELLELLKPLLERRIGALEQGERALESQIAASQLLQGLLDRHLLWIPSHAPVGLSWLERLPDGAYDLVNPSRYLTTLQLVWRDMGESPLPWLGSLLLVALLVELRRRAPGHITAEAAVTRQIRSDTYRATARALAWTIAAALPGPVALALVGELLQTVGSPGKFTDSLGRACVVIAMPLFTLQLLRWSAIERGLGHAHFRWVRARREALRTVLPRAAAVVLPMYLISVLAFNRNLDLPNDVQARLGIVLACLTLAWTAWYALDVGRAWASRGINSDPTVWRKVLRVALPVVPVVTAALALGGYVHSAGMLLHAMLSTFNLVVGVTLVLGLLARWFLLGERRLAMHRQEEVRAAPVPGDERAAPAADAEGEVTLEQVNAQTSRLLRALRLTLFGGGLIWVWAEVLPAFARADEIALWHFTDTAPDGASISLPVTLAAVLLGLFAFTMTAIGARNLPGLVEIGLLSKTRIDAATRYAITSVLRYAIVITGMLIGLNLLGLRWSQLQWMAAALTVGLGFGLQEIFANFVSGLILLFERPFRIGDIITVGELSGRVTRIRTRATTIVDFENKEIVVPNKTFITGQLINWTLSDTTTRVTINVGVAYGTDPAKVHELLMKAAESNPMVLTDPPPKSWFLQFGASSLDFELRVFVANIVERLEVQNALNMQIAALFAQHGVEIAFPQLDLHVRDVPRAQWNGDAPPATAE